MQAIHNKLMKKEFFLLSCFKEQRYKINASNSQLRLVRILGFVELFQRAKIQDKCKQFTTKVRKADAPELVVSKSKDTR